jgi:N-acetylglutamate synthase-like GNAT family acetyltransferase
MPDAYNEKNLKITFATEQEFQSAQDFYTSVGYTSSIHSNDTVLAASYNSKIIGVVRIAYEHNIPVLRGMMIAEEFQRKGIGTLMLKELETKIKSNCFCLPHDWLESFYGQIGFKKIQTQTAPNFLKERLEDNKKKYPHLIIMQRT